MSFVIHILKISICVHNLHPRNPYSRVYKSREIYTRLLLTCLCNFFFSSPTRILSLVKLCRRNCKIHQNTMSHKTLTLFCCYSHSFIRRRHASILYIYIYIYINKPFQNSPIYPVFCFLSY